MMLDDGAAVAVAVGLPSDIPFIPLEPPELRTRCAELAGHLVRAGTAAEAPEEAVSMVSAILYKF
jgi:hypothetical protein